MHLTNRVRHHLAMTCAKRFAVMRVYMSPGMHPMMRAVMGAMMSAGLCSMRALMTYRVPRHLLFLLCTRLFIARFSGRLRL